MSGANSVDRGLEASTCGARIATARFFGWERSVGAKPDFLIA
jgi:hypothetical protein